jgi:uncharacterized protein (DUF58 family)
VYIARRPAIALVAVAVVAALARGVAVPIAIALDVALIALIVADVLTTPGPASLGVTREVPGVLGVGRSDTITIVFHNPIGRRVPVSIRDSAPPSLQRDPLRHSIVLDGGAWERAAAEIRPGRRGVAMLGPLTVRTGGRFRLAGRQRSLPVVDRVKVYPALPGRAEVELRLTRARLLQAGERSSAVRGGGGEFDSLRDYHPDDEFRRINWAATARADKPISNTYRQERNQQVVLLLDAGRLMATTIAGVSLFEHGIDAAMAVAELGARIGDHVGALAFSSKVLAMVGPRGGRAQPRRILDSLYAVAPTLDAPDYRRAFATLLARYRRRSLLVLLTELNDEAALDSLYGALPVLLRRHLVVVGSARDPVTDALAATLPSSSEQVYAKVAAVQALDARERAAGRLRAMGVDVVDRPAGELAGAIADRYLRAKATGRL